VEFKYTQSPLTGDFGPSRALHDPLSISAAEERNRVSLGIWISQVVDGDNLPGSYL